MKKQYPPLQINNEVLKAEGSSIPFHIQIYTVNVSSDLEIGNIHYQVVDDVVKKLNSHNKLVKALQTLREDCNMALAGTWDKSDSGFEDSITMIDTALKGLE